MFGLERRLRDVWSSLGLTSQVAYFKGTPTGVDNCPCWWSFEPKRSNSMQELFIVFPAPASEALSLTHPVVESMPIWGDLAGMLRPSHPRSMGIAYKDHRWNLKMGDSVRGREVYFGVWFEQRPKYEEDPLLLKGRHESVCREKRASWWNLIYRKGFGTRVYFKGDAMVNI